MRFEFIVTMSMSTGEPSWKETQISKDKQGVSWYSQRSLSMDVRGNAILFVWVLGIGINIPAREKGLETLKTLDGNTLDILFEDDHFLIKPFKVASIPSAIHFPASP